MSPCQGDIVGGREPGRFRTRDRKTRIFRGPQQRKALRRMIDRQPLSMVVVSSTGGAPWRDALQMDALTTGQCIHL
jgi:hypothetical protein